ncbi:MAG: hypothetical protein QF660_01105 [Anaerolineales bacterium]|nr:hypothetical protein [Anaerolineales bacterium]
MIRPRDLIQNPRWVFSNPEARALTGLLIATLVFFWPLLLGGEWHIPKGGGDLESFLWPTYRYAAETLRSGELPFWNPYLHAGSPYAADNQSGLFYPLNLLLALLPDVPYRAMEWLVPFHVLLAGTGTYFAARHHHPHARPQAPLAAALAFQFSSLFITHIGNLNIVATSAYLPWAWLFLHRMQDKRSLSSAATLALVLSLATLVGHAQMAIVIATAISLAAIWMTVALPDKTQWVGLCTLVVALTLGLCAFFVFPTIELTQYSLRSGLTYTEASAYSLPPTGLAGMLSPILFGRGPEHFWPSWDRVELGFAGLITILLAPFGLRQNSRRGILLLLAAVGVLIALGPATPAHSIMYQYLPGFSMLRVPARFLLLTNFALAMLACKGLHLWQKAIIPSTQIMSWAAILAGLTAIALPLAWYLASSAKLDAAPQTLPLAVATALITLAAALVIGPRWVALLLAVELIGLGAWVEVDKTNPDEGYHSGPAVALLRAQPGPFRIDVATGNWQPDAPTVHRIEAINGLHNPLGLAHYNTYYWAVGHRGSPQYNFLNAKYLIADKGTPAADASFIPVFDADPHVDIYLNPNAQPRISLVYEAIITKTPTEAFAAVHASGFNPNTQVVLEGGAALSAQPPIGTKLGYLSYSTHRQSVKAITPTPAYLVFSEVWYPGWRATLDGNPISLLRANYAFRAIYLPAGEHIVELNFSPTGWRYASSISIFSAISIILILVTSSRKRQKPQHA